MPIYEYQCSKCSKVTERLQGIHEPALKKCPSCGGRAEKKMSSGAFVLKGSGWHSTDYAHKGNGKGDAKPPSCPAFAEASAGKPAAEGGKVPPACAGCPKAE